MHEDCKASQIHITVNFSALEARNYGRADRKFTLLFYFSRFLCYLISNATFTSILDKPWCYMNIIKSYWYSINLYYIKLCSWHLCIDRCIQFKNGCSENIYIENGWNALTGTWDQYTPQEFCGVKKQVISQTKTTLILKIKLPDEYNIIFCSKCNHNWQRKSLNTVKPLI